MDISGQKGNKTMDISHVINPSSSVSSQRDYEVFLRFRGPDMHSGFADFLYTSLTDVGICVFRRKGELESGKEIDPQLIQAIEQSKVSIPVISREYASSESCLLELDQMVKCMMDNKNRIIIPIFYYVNPSDVCDFSDASVGALGEQKKHDRDGTLRCIGELERHHLHEKNEGSHGKVVKQIVHQVQQKLKKQELIVTKQFVRDDCHVHCIMAKLKVDYCKGQVVKIGDTSVTMLGIYGIPGVGKTVLAKYVYNQLYHLFDACSFLGEIQAEIRHHDILSLQNKLISDLGKGNAEKFDSSEKALHILKNFHTKKVLILLDDVYDHEQLSALVGGLDWLGLGSRVILTSQTQDVLGSINGAESSVLEPMKPDEALKLFCRHAFGTDSPPEKFMILSREIVNATERLPLELEVIGSSLFLVKSKKAWSETLNALKVAPHKRVQAALEKSYNNLHEKERKIFLDIACFFNKMDKRIPYYMWDDCKYFPSRSIQALIARSLIKIGQDKKILMLETLEKFGQEIVKNENRNEPCRRSRLWNHEEALNVQGRKEGTENVKASKLKFDDTSKWYAGSKYDQFDGLQNLMFVKLDSDNNPEDLGDNLSSLRWLHWPGNPTTFDFKSLTLKFPNLAILDFSGAGRARGDGRDWKLPVEARQLKVLNLTRCSNLKFTPKFHASMELERLILENCYSLAVIHPSIGNLKKLVSLNVKGCSHLRKLPDLGPMRGLKELLIDETSISRIHFQNGSMTMLKTLSACKCKNLTDLSDLLQYFKSLKYLALDGTGIVTLGESIGSLEKLKRLSLRECRGLSNLPDDIGGLRSLQFLDLSDTLIRELPPSVKNLKDMKVLRMSRTSIQEFPEDILNLEKLEEIDFTSCGSLAGKLPDDIERLSSLAILKLSDTRICGPLPPSISRLSRLREIHISGC